jgi:outer membrane protein TolC
MAYNYTRKTTNHAAMKILALYLIMCVMTGVVAAQRGDGSDTMETIEIPPLSVFEEAAVQNSSLLKIKHLEADKIEQYTRVERKRWMDFVSVEGASNYGSFNQVLQNYSTTPPVEATGNELKSEQFNYYAGVSVKIPISTFASHGNEMKIKKIEKQQAVLEGRNIENTIRQQVVDEYHRLLYLRESMNIFGQIYQTLDISLQKTERDMLKGLVSINDFALLTSTVGKAKDDYSKAKNNFFAQYRKMEYMTGLDLMKTGGK